MPFRDDEGAARARADVLEGKLRDAEAEIARLKGVPAPAAEAAPAPARPWALHPGLWLALTVCTLGAGVVLERRLLAAPYDLALPAIGALSVLCALGVAATTALSFRLFAGPAELLVISGRPPGYRLVRPGGATLRMPLVERVDRMDLTAMNVEVSVSNAYSKNGQVLALDVSAVVGIESSEPRVRHAVERFLGKKKDEIAAVARQTVEGHIREVVAQLEPREILGDREKFAQTILEISESDFAKLGLRIDRLTVGEIRDRG